MTTYYYSLAAAGSTQGTALALGAVGSGPETIYEVTTATASTATGVMLPAAASGKITQVTNMSGITISIYPQVGGTVAGGATNAATTLATGSSAIFRTQDSGVTWATVSTSTGFANGNANVVKVTAATVLTAAQSGSYVAIHAGGAFTITLPTPALGLRFAFSPITANPVGNVAIGVTAAANINGVVLGAATPVAVATQSFVNITSANGKVGDILNFVSLDGTTWTVSGQGQTAGAFTTTA